MAIKKTKSIKSLVIKTLSEGREPFEYLSYETVDFINNANLNENKKEFSVDFTTKGGIKAKLTTPDEHFYKWVEKYKKDNKENLVNGFLEYFLDNAKTIEDEVKKEEPLSEIIDDTGNIMGDDDLPSNATNALVGKSRFDTDKVVRQTSPKSKRAYSDLGFGSVVWE